ncbi:hypothetical protein [Flagellimonas sp. HMM57]
MCRSCRNRLVYTRG